MSDSESSTDPEDFEYIPEGEDARSDSEASVGGEEEEKRGVSKSRSNLKSGRTCKPSLNTSQCRSKDDVSGGDEDGGEGGGEKETEVEEREKARIDDLWASFKQDTEAKPKHRLLADGDTPRSSKVETKTEPRMVKIMKTYDFAGDEIVVEEEVSADSKEAQQSLHTPQESPSTTSTTTSSSSSTTSDTTRPAVAVAPGSSALHTGKRRSGGLSSVLQSLTKKSKMSTLEKSQLDWTRFKEDEGLEHELSQQRKDGYLEKQDFLQRTDWRQYELEREERLKKFRRLH